MANMKYSHNCCVFGMFFFLIVSALSLLMECMCMTDHLQVSNLQRTNRSSSTALCCVSFFFFFFHPPLPSPPAAVALPLPAAAEDTKTSFVVSHRQSVLSSNGQWSHVMERSTCTDVNEFKHCLLKFFFSVVDHLAAKQTKKKGFLCPTDGFSCCAMRTLLYAKAPVCIVGGHSCVTLHLLLLVTQLIVAWLCLRGRPDADLV